MKKIYYGIHGTRKGFFNESMWGKSISKSFFFFDPNDVDEKRILNSLKVAIYFAFSNKFWKEYILENNLEKESNEPVLILLKIETNNCSCVDIDDFHGEGEYTIKDEKTLKYVKMNKKNPFNLKEYKEVTIEHFIDKASEIFIDYDFGLTETAFFYNEHKGQVVKNKTLSDYIFRKCEEIALENYSQLAINGEMKQ